MKAFALGAIPRFVLGIAAVGWLLEVRANAATYYWDANGATAGSGNSGGSWSGTNWTADASGQSATMTWLSGADAVFSAGSDGTGAIGVTVAGTQGLDNLTVSSGSVTLSGGGFSLSGSATWTTNAGSVLNVQSSINANGNVLTVGGGGSTTFGGAITTSRGLNISGGTVVLAASNPLAGGVAVNSGLLNVQNSRALGVGGIGSDATVSSGASLQLSNTAGISVNNVTLTLGGSGVSNIGALQNVAGNNIWGGPVLLSADTLINTASGSLTISNYVLGGFNITKIGSGMLALSASNAAGFLGSITDQAGTLDVSNAGALGLSIGGGTVSVGSGATLSVHGGINIGQEPVVLAGIGLGGAGALRNTGDNNSLAGVISVSSLNTQLSVDNGTLTLSGAITGNGGVAKTGSGALVLSNTTSNFAGPLSVASGILTVPLVNNANTSGPFGSSSAAVELASGGTATLEYTGATATNSRAFTLAAGGVGVFQIDAAATNLNLSGALGGGGSLQKAGSGVLTLSGSSNYAGSTLVTDGTLAIPTTGSINGSSAIVVGQNATLQITNSGTSQLQSSATVTLSGGSLVFIGNGSVSAPLSAGVLVFGPGQSSVSASETGPPTHTPVISFSDNQASPTIGATVNFSGNLAQIQFQAAPNFLNGILGGGEFYGNDFATATTTSPYTVEALANYTVGDLGELVSNAALNVKPSGTQSPVSEARAINSLNLTGSMSVAMTNSGSLALASGGLLANTTGTMTGGTLSGSLDGSLTVDAAQPFSISSVIADNGGSTALVKTGTGTLTLTGSNTFTGDTYVNQGTLQIAPTANLAYGGAIRGAGNLTKAGTATLTLSGISTLTGNTTIAGGNLCVNVSAHHNQS